MILDLALPMQPTFLIPPAAPRFDGEKRPQPRLDYDAQTYLLTSCAFLARAAAAVQRRRRDPRRCVSLAVLALDSLPAIESRHGSAVCGEAVFRTATLLRRNCVPGESAGRYQDAGFALLLDDQRPAQAHDRIGRLRRQLTRVQLDSVAGSFRITWSCGVADLAYAMTLEAWTAAAERALATARAAGGNRIEIAP